MKRNKESKARIRVFNYLKLNKKQQAAADFLVKKYKLTYLMVYNCSLHFDGWYEFPQMVAEYLYSKESKCVDYHANSLKQEYEDYLKAKIHISIIKKPFVRPDVQGTSSLPYFVYNKKFDTTLCRRILDGAL